MYINHIVIIHLLMGTWACFHSLTTMDRAAVNMNKQVSPVIRHRERPLAEKLKIIINPEVLASIVFLSNKPIWERTEETGPLRYPIRGPDWVMV